MLGTHDCASVAACLNTRGTFVCQCPNGYFGDGKTCTGMLNSFIIRLGSSSSCQAGREVKD